jgi:hypothetical protein
MAVELRDLIDNPPEVPEPPHTMEPAERQQHEEGWLVGFKASLRRVEPRASSSA